MPPVNMQVPLVHVRLATGPVPQQAWPEPPHVWAVHIRLVPVPVH